MRNSRAAVFLMFVGLAIALPVSSAFANGANEKRCGWLENPTPANWSLLDRDGEWLIGEQGGYQAPGIDNMPDMSTQGWIETNAGGHGYGCACLTAQVDKKKSVVTRLVSAQPLPLQRCKSDSKLRAPAQ